LGEKTEQTSQGSNKSKPGERKPFPRKIRKKISRQKEAIRRWLTEKYATTDVLDEVSDYDEEWCDDCFERNCEAHMRGNASS
jgi:hypothetical protein